MNQSTQINLIGCDIIVNSPSFMIVNCHSNAMEDNLKKMEDDLKKKHEDEPINPNQPNWL